MPIYARKGKVMNDDIDILLDDGLTYKQEIYFKSCLRRLVQEGYKLSLEQEMKVWKSLGDRKGWESSLSTFRARTSLMLKSIRAKQDAKKASERGEDNVPSDSHVCMYLRCQESRNRPWAHWVRWWDNTSDEFIKVWPEISDNIKPKYRSKDWIDKHNFYGIFLCNAHFSQLRGKFPFSGSDSTPKPSAFVEHHQS